MRNQSSVCPRNSCAGGYGNCLDVKITNLCNGNCAFCIERGGYSPENQKGPVELALATVNDTPQRTGMTRVLYPNAQITSGWIGNTDGCHNVSGGCH